MSVGAAHLVRHGEVDNPHHVVYSDLPGYALSQLGIEQAAATASHLASRRVQSVVSSPLLRARQTAEAIAAAHNLPLELDERLTEWTLALRWSGVRWEDVETVFPGELTAYLEHPYDLEFAAESLEECGARVAATVDDWAARLTGGDLVVVSHQDPIHAGAMALTGDIVEPYHSTKPTHGAVITIAPDSGGWARRAFWEPPQGATFPPGI